MMSIHDDCGRVKGRVERLLATTVRLNDRYQRLTTARLSTDELSDEALRVAAIHQIDAEWALRNALDNLNEQRNEFALHLSRWGATPDLRVSHTPALVIGGGVWQ